MAPLSEPEARKALRQIEQDWQHLLLEIKGQTVRDTERLRSFAHKVAIGLVVMTVVTIIATVGGIIMVGREAARADRNAEQLRTVVRQLAETQRQQRESRRLAILDLCEARNETHLGVIRFVQAVSPHLGRRAVREFPIIPSCRDYADRLVHAGMDR